MTRHNSTFYLVFLAIFSIILLTVLVWGVYDIQRKNKESSALLNTADEAAEISTLAQAIRTAQSHSANELAAFDALVLSENKLVPLIDDIERAGRSLALETDIVSVEKAEDKESAATIINMVVEAEGPWSATLSFLRAIESLPHRVMIQESNLAKAETGWRLRIAFSLHSFD